MKKTNVTLNLNLTFLKIMGTVIILCGFAYGLITREHNVTLNALWIGFACYGTKKGLDTIRVVSNGTNSLKVKDEVEC